ncbi:hypothetical protein V8Z77_08250 [Stutzerimonas stutzeri]|jgi:hypothetical protein|uniref:hypothetical protein n=1 Tax=Pseudomonadaceae TaxID=135621 RepID=UPI000C9AA1CF|nr:hypothetical protein [Stutzerimonas stutzeri]MBU0525857.1 hypothetical protein [Gammaproteobacteria bacterium]MBU2370388.1 hypothetical protein [Alphaproteobacteria bacterium]HCG39047.1 hypothetical protein [Pseudomonas sp.]MBU0837119.1 hypothetical protein [Gammaproteobacteria bacterium]MBU1807017.1 hypothetical protein [Gammaproteobacteria bacterium]
MSSLTQLAMKHGDQMMSAGYALETLADLLGGDGSEHHLSSQDLDGLRHAVRALGGFALLAGAELCQAAEQGGAQ